MIRNSLQSCFFLFNNVLLFFISVSSNAQDSHHWTQQYGTRSMLLSGSIIGGVNDLSEDDNWSGLLPGGGAGLRYLAIKEHNINLGIDIAVGKGDWGIYFRIGEAF